MEKIGIVGTGKVAQALSKAFFDLNLSISFIYGRDEAKAHSIAKQYQSKSAISLDFTHDDIDILLICIKDDAIRSVASEIKVHNHVVVAHTSGTHELNLIDNYFDQAGIFWPVQTFTEQRYLDLKQVPLCIEGNTSRSENLLRNLAQRISENTLIINADQRKALHTAAVISCNFSNFLFYHAKLLLDQNELSFELLKPLLLETIEKAFDMDPLQAQTGPAVRKDFKTIKMQQGVIKADQTLDIYNFLTKKILDSK